jgi:hypothetical protein
VLHTLATDPALLTVEEMADDLQAFATSLAANRVSLIRFGVPQLSLGRSWPGQLLTYCYPTTLIVWEAIRPVVHDLAPTSPRERALSQSPTATCARHVHTYAWDRHPTTQKRVQLPDLDPAQAQRLEAGREAFVHLEIAMLRCLANALRVGDAQALWDQALALLNATLSADDVDFYLQMDTWYYGWAITAGTAPEDGALPVFPGGLSRLLELIGHGEQELRIGTMAQTRARLSRLPGDGAPVRSYFSAVGRPWITDLDQARDRYLALTSEEAAFWSTYHARVNAARATRWTAEFVYRKRGNAAQIAAFAPDVRGYAEAQWARLVETGELFPLVLAEPQAPASAGRPPRILRSDGRVRTYEFEGTVTAIRETKGHQYLAVLLLHPQQAIHVFDLIAIVDHPPAASSALPAGTPRDAERLGLHVDHGDGTGPALDAQAKRQYQDEARRLEEALAEAQEVGDEAEIASIRDRLEWIACELTRNTALRGRHRPMNSAAERAQNKISKQITSAKRELAVHDPELGIHLTHVRHDGPYWRYAPPAGQPRWQRAG